MPKIREIPLTFGTLVLFHRVDRPDEVHASWRASTSPIQSSYNVDSDLEVLNDTKLDKGSLNADMGNVKSAAISASGSEVSVTGDVSWNKSDPANGGGVHFSGPYAPFVSAEFSPTELIPLSSPGTQAAGDEMDSGLNVVIGPKIVGTATAQKPYVCEICGRPFRRRNYIRRHVLTHSSNRPYGCKVCWTTFRSRDYLRRHFRRVHGQCYPVNGGLKPRLPLVEQQQRSAEECCASGQAVTEHSPSEQSDSRAGEPKCEVLSPDLQEAKERQRSLVEGRSTEQAAIDANASEQVDEQADKDALDIEVQTDELAITSQAIVLEAEASPKNVPKSQNRGCRSESKEAEDGPFICGTCGNLMPRRNVLIFTTQSTTATQSHVLCKVCLARKTGLLCIG